MPVAAGFPRLPKPKLDISYGLVLQSGSMPELMPHADGFQRMTKPKLDISILCVHVTSFLWDFLLALHLYLY